MAAGSKYDNNMTGALFKNDKNGNAKAPDYVGSAEVDGVKYNVAGWANEKKDTKEKYLKIKFSIPQAKGEGRPAPKNDNFLD